VLRPFLNINEKVLTRAKDVLPHINRMQAPKSARGSDAMVLSTAAACCWQRAHTFRMLLGGEKSAKHVFCPW